MAGERLTGGVVTFDGTYYTHTFDVSGTLDLAAGETSVEVEYAVIGGGGGGGVGVLAGGGGGAGEMRAGLLTVTGPVGVTVGAGGAGGPVGGGPGGDGGATTFGGLVCAGGGGGGGVGALDGRTGGQGGGWAMDDDPAEPLSAGAVGDGGIGVQYDGNRWSMNQAVWWGRSDRFGGGGGGAGGEAVLVRSAYPLTAPYEATNTPYWGGPGVPWPEVVGESWFLPGGAGFEGAAGWVGWVYNESTSLWEQPYWGTHWWGAGGSPGVKWEYSPGMPGVGGTGVGESSESPARAGVIGGGGGGGYVGAPGDYTTATWQAYLGNGGDYWTGETKQGGGDGGGGRVAVRYLAAGAVPPRPVVGGHIVEEAAGDTAATRHCFPFGGWVHRAAETSAPTVDVFAVGGGGGAGAGGSQSASGLSIGAAGGGGGGQVAESSAVLEASQVVVGTPGWSGVVQDANPAQWPLSWFPAGTVSGSTYIANGVGAGASSAVGVTAAAGGVGGMPAAGPQALDGGNGGGGAASPAGVVAPGSGTYDGGAALVAAGAGPGGVDGFSGGGGGGAGGDGEPGSTPTFEYVNSRWSATGGGAGGPGVVSWLSAVQEVANGGRGVAGPAADSDDPDGARYWGSGGSGTTGDAAERGMAGFVSVTVTTEAPPMTTVELDTTGSGDWIDISADTYTVEIDRASTRTVGIAQRYQGGRMKVALDNTTRTWEPVGGDLRLGLRVRVSAYNGTTNVPLLIARVEQIDCDYPGHAMEGRTVLVCGDLVSVLARVEIPEIGAAVGAGDPVSTRLERICDTISLPANNRDIDFGGVTLTGTTFGGSSWDLMTDAVRWEIGDVWVSQVETVRFRTRGEQATSPASATFDDAGAGIRYADPRFGYDDELLTNVIRYNREGVGTTTTILDATSIATLSLGVQLAMDAVDVPIDNDLQADNWALMQLDLLATPAFRCESVRLEPRFLPDSELATVLDLDIADKVVVKFTPPGGGAQLSSEVKIGRISHKLGPGRAWSMTVGMWPLHPAA